jgi:DNA-directed RNA polymerase specialized sigma24 family protein
MNLSDRDEALDLSQEVFLRVFHHPLFPRAVEPVDLIYRIAVNQARNRHRSGAGATVADQVSLDQHIEAHGDFSDRRSTPDRVLAQKELAEKFSSTHSIICRSISAPRSCCARSTVSATKKSLSHLVSRLAR